MSKTSNIIFPLLILISAILISCAAQRKLTPSEMDELEYEFVQMLESKQEKQANSAYLMQVRMRTPEL
ncbi:MAG: hypothetical protein GWN14_13680, partial [candidate division Zixibacteria bacterium]|nr:hypothetical protein [candidate division Zixibacteria bacterium]NIX56932.1 hypothetical protein [candidate division Zixibacteria bacterium]